MDDDLSVYQLNVQSADKLDERRDAAARSHGVMCIVLTTAATGSFEMFPIVSAVLWVFLAVVALAWFASLRSLTAKLSAKCQLLMEMEKNQEVPTSFLVRERQQWEKLDKSPLHNALQHTPIAFVVLGSCGFLGTLLFVACNMISR
ncbi:MAG: hypothetical protein OXN96_03870 [Bryobacterales bacterium]|nr:hypothetical protein [Bryobacterales bacterium]